MSLMVSLAALMSMSVSYEHNKDAMLAVAQCEATVTEVEPCHGIWKGLHFTIYSDQSGSITLPSGKKWSYACRQDKVESANSCWIYQDSFYLWSRNHSLSSVSWGSEAYPGSQRIAKFGNNPPMRWVEDQTISGAGLKSVLTELRSNSSAIFRWYNWPWNAAQDSEVDLTNFPEVLDIFMAVDLGYPS